MTNSKPLTVYYFSDILCVWAYIAQVRVEELKQNYAERIVLDYRSISIFGDAPAKLAENWDAKGGLPAYNKLLNKLAGKYPHVQIHPDLWLDVVPKSSTPAHVLISAVQCLERIEEVEEGAAENLAWQLRLAFFRDNKDIANLSSQQDIIESLNLPVSRVLEQLSNGAAYASQEQDVLLKGKYNISGSPTFVFNEGRQILYGNVGYRVIDANIRELLEKPDMEASWC